MFLAYFMALAEEQGHGGVSLRSTLSALDGAPMEWLKQDEILCACAPAPEGLSKSGADSLRIFALKFYAVVRQAFMETTVLPFRFPTLFPDDDAIRRFLSEHARGYSADLQRLLDTVQLELNLSRPEEEHPASGTQYLRARQSWSNRVEELQERLRGVNGVCEVLHRRRGSREQIVLLVARGAQPEVEAAVAQWGAGGPVRLTGPWPPSAFVKYHVPPGRETQS